jgi:integrase/recombinase XerC
MIEKYKHIHKINYTTERASMNEVITTIGQTVITADGRTAVLQAFSFTHAMLEDFILFLDARPTTVTTYRAALKRFFLYLAENEITKPGRADILAYRDALKAERKPGTVSLYMTAVRLFFQWTQAEGTYPDIAAHVKGAKIDSTHKRDPLTATQAIEIAKGIDRNTVQGTRDYAIYSAMVTGGLRCIEIVRLDIEDMRNEGGRVFLHVTGKGKDEKQRVSISEQTAAAIRAYLSLSGRANAGDNEPMFASLGHWCIGERLTPRSVSRIVKESMKGAGIDNKRISAHSLRHTAATTAFLSGMDKEQVRKQLRHGKLSTTEIYIHEIESFDNRFGATVGAALGL